MPADRFLVHGTMAPSRRFLLRSGMTWRGSISIFTPRPVHSGHAPYGELNENMRGASSSNDRPHSRQANFSEKLSSSSSVARPVSATSADRVSALRQLERGLDRIGRAACGGRA